MATSLRPTVLVVDDEEMIRDVVAESLSDEGYPVIQATNGQEALDAVSAHRPAVILLDMRMPVLDGWGFMRELKLRPGHDAAVVVMTAARNARQWCDEVGADECLPKPFEIEQLIGMVERLASGAPGNDN